MKKILALLESYIKTYLSQMLSALVLIFVLLILVTMALAQNEPAWLKASDSKEATSALKQYLSKKYVIEDAELQIEKDTYGNPRRSLYIRGDLTPKKSITPKVGEHGRDRAVAEAFLEEEAATLLGFINITDLREFKIFTDRFGTDIRYRRYVDDLLFDETEIIVRMKPDGKIHDVSVYNLSPIPPN